MGFTVNLSLSTVANTLNGRGGIVALSCIDTSIGGAINSYKVGFSGIMVLMVGKLLNTVYLAFLIIAYQLALIRTRLLLVVLSPA